MEADGSLKQKLAEACRSAQEYLDAGRPADAVACLEAVVSRDIPEEQRARVLSLLGLGCLRQRQFAKAASHMEKAVSFIPQGDLSMDEQADLYRHLAAASSAMGELERAREHFEKAYKLPQSSQKKAEAAVGLAEVYQEIGDQANSLRWSFQALGECAPEVKESVAGVALTLVRARVRAVPDYGPGNDDRLEQWDALLCETLATIYSQWGNDFDMAEYLCRRAMSLRISLCDEVGLGRVLLIYATVLEKAGNTNGAAEQLKQALEIFQYHGLRKETNQAYTRFLKLRDPSSNIS